MDAEVVHDPSLPAEVVVLSPALAIQLGAGGRGRAWLDLTPPVHYESSGGEQASRTGSMESVQLAALGDIWRGDELIRVGAQAPMRFLAADAGEVTRTLTEGLGTGRGLRHVVEFEWVLPAEPGDVLIDAEGREVRVLGYEGPTAAEIRRTLPRMIRDATLPPTTPLHSLPLSPEAASALETIGLRTLGELVATSDAELLRTKRISRRLQKELAHLVAAASRRSSLPCLEPTSRRIVRSAELLRPPFQLQLPRVRRALIARSTGPRDPLLGWPRDPAPQLTQRQLAALWDMGAAASAEEAVWRSDVTRTSLWEDFANGVPPWAATSATSRVRAELESRFPGAKDPFGWTRPVEYLDALLSVLGLGLELEPHGFRLVPTLLGASQSSPAVASGETPPCTRRGSTTDAWSHGAVTRAALEAPPALDSAQVLEAGEEELFRRFEHIPLEVPLLPTHFAQLVAARLRFSPESLVATCLREGAASVAARLGSIEVEGGVVPLERLLYRVVPVLPRGLRSTPGCTLVLSDRYLELFDRNLALRALRASNAPAHEVEVAVRDLQVALDGLLGHAPSLSRDVGGPRSGVFSLLSLALPESRGVDFAAKTTVVVDPSLSPRTVAVGVEVLREVLRPRVVEQLLDLQEARALTHANSMVDSNDPTAFSLLSFLAIGSPVWMAAADQVSGARVCAVDDGASLRMSHDTAQALGVRTGDRCVIHWPLSESRVNDEVRLVGAAPARGRGGWMALLERGSVVGPTELVSVALRGEVDEDSLAARGLRLRVPPISAGGGRRAAPEAGS